MVFLSGIAFTGFSQKENKKQAKTSATLKSPKDIRIINLLMEKDNIYAFCNNFYDFYYSQTENTNKYYLVEKGVVQDSVRKYNAVKVESLDLKLVLMDDQKYEKVFVVPLH